MQFMRAAKIMCGVALVLGMAVHLTGQQGQPASAQQTQASQQAESRCSAPEYRQMDFVLGSWEVSNKGKKTADVTFERTSTSTCGVLETWRNANGGGGNGLFGNSPVGHGWQYFWVPSSGQPTWLHDGKPTGKDDEMQFTLTRTQPDGASHVSQWTVTKTADGHIRELSVNTEDGKTEYELIWTKK